MWTPLGALLELIRLELGCLLFLLLGSICLKVTPYWSFKSISPPSSLLQTSGFSLSQSSL